MKQSLRGGVKGGHSVVAPNYQETQFQHTEQVHDEQDGHQYWPKGLTNVGNTCYANATLQCLLSTSLTTALLDPRTVPILRRYSSNPNLLAMGSGSVDSEDDLLVKTPTAPLNECEMELIRKEKEKRRMHENCSWLTKELTHLTQEYTAEPDERSQREQSSVMGWLTQPVSPESVVDPGSITRHCDRLSTCLRPYQQEDAHEFLRALLSTLVMNGHNKKLSSLFDGLLESSVTCRTCGRASLTRDRYMDISLDINDPAITSLDDALYEYTKNEILDEDNAVFCQKCKKKRSVNKGLRLATAPSILVCHLKRFAFDDYGRLVRLHKKIDFPQRLQIGDFMSNLNKARPPPYDLVGILVHQGQTCASGHYLAFVKKQGEWYRCNDSVVTKVDEATVLNQQAYIMMYEVAEMREKICTPRTKRGKQIPVPFMDEDEPELLKDDSRSTNACGSFKSSDRSRRSSRADESSQAPVERLLQFLSEAEGGVSRFLADMCCDNTNAMNEPMTHEMKRNRRRQHREEQNASAAANSGIHPDLRRSLSSECLQVIEDRQMKKGFRAQTAPRQRSNSYDTNVEAGFNMDSPRTTYSARSETHHRQQISNGRGARNTKSRKSRSIHDLAESGDLPPLPTTPGRARRAKSNASARKKGGYMVV
jgi:hypothetical protein